MSGRPVAAASIQRILALVPWVVAHPGTPKDEIARQFGIGVGQLDADLALVLMIGVPPYSPGDYLDVDEDDNGTVTIRLADCFRRPLRLTPAEGLSLLAAGRALLAVPGSDPAGPLATALAKLERALDVRGVVVDVAAAEHLAAVRAAVERSERIEIDYWSAGREELTARAVDPTVVFFALGAWYVSAYCHRAGGDRMFRVDRIRAVRPTGTTFTARADAVVAGEVFTPSPGDPRVTLRLTPAATWVAEAFPTEAVTEHADGSLDVVLAVSEPAWLERLLLQLGPAATVLEPADLRGAAATAARRVLARYGDPGGAPGGTAAAADGGHDHPDPRSQQGA